MVFNIYCICVMTRCAETGSVPPAFGVIVSAVVLSAGFRTVKMELILVVVTMAMPIIWLVSVARPTTVYASSLLFSVSTN